VDTVTRPVYGPQAAGRVVEINGRDIELVGQYDLGIGFFELGAVTVSDQNFIRLFRDASLDDVAIGLIRLRSGSDPDLIAQRLRRSLPEDVYVLTRADLAAHEVHHWLTKTSTGMIFGSGVIVAFLVGLVILTQTLTAQILNNILQYATLKAMGYSNRYLNRVVLEQAILLAFTGFLPGCAISLGLYELVRHRAYLPIAMTPMRVVGELVLTVGMSAVAGAFAVRKLGRADPVDLF
jgi:putative ABC transport system permease protein